MKISNIFVMKPAEFPQDSKAVGRATQIKGDSMLAARALDHPIKSTLEKREEGEKEVKSFRYACKISFVLVAQ